MLQAFGSAVAYPSISSDLSSLTLEDIDSVSEANQAHRADKLMPLSTPSWASQFTTNPYGPSYVSQPLSYAPPPPYNMIVPNEKMPNSGSGKCAVGLFITRLQFVLITFSRWPCSKQCKNLVLFGDLPTYKLGV